MRVAKLLILFFVFFSLTLVAEAQKPLTLKKNRTIKVVPKKTKQKPISTVVNKDPLVIHRNLHKKLDWWEWMKYDNVQISFLLSGPVFEIKYFSLNRKNPSEKIFTLKWDQKTIFFVKNEVLVGKCFFLVYCGIDNKVLLVEEQLCSSEFKK